MQESASKKTHAKKQKISEEDLGFNPRNWPKNPILQKVLKSLGLKHTGVRTELIQRLIDAAINFDDIDEDAGAIKKKSPFDITINNSNNNNNDNNNISNDVLSPVLLPISLTPSTPSTPLSFSSAVGKRKRITKSLAEEDNEDDDDEDYSQ